VGFRELRENWNAFGAQDPLWAILTQPGKQWSVEEFFETGRGEIAALMQRLEDFPGRARRRALDFGCGVGRLTQALAEHFDEACGVDVAPSMIELANRYNRHGERCQYTLHQEPNLDCFADASFDLIYSRNTLQHMQPRYMRRYLREFLRVAAPGGAIVFGLTGGLTRERLTHRFFGPLARFLRHRIYWKLFRRGEPRMDMYGIPREQVIRILEDCGGKVIAVEPDASLGPAWNGYFYFVTKPLAAMSAQKGRI
jgi:SAM-dependent methyltransferase